MEDKVAQQILNSLSKLDDKVSIVQNDLNEMKLQFAEKSAMARADIERHSKDIDALHNIHRECKNERCIKYAEVDAISKKVSGVELFCKILSVVSSFIIVAFAIYKAVKG